MRRIKWNKKLFISGCILICVFALLSGCNMAEKRNGDEQGPSQVISEINVWSAAQNENHIYHVRYPYYYYFFEPSSGGGVKSSLGDLENIQYSSDLTEEEFDYFVNYLKILIHLHLH